MSEGLNLILESNGLKWSVVNLWGAREAGFRAGGMAFQGVVVAA